MPDMLEGVVAALVHMAAADQAPIDLAEHLDQAAARRLRHVAERGLGALRIVGHARDRAACARTARPACRRPCRALRRSQSNCSASLSRPVFMISELSPMKHQPAASKCQRSSPSTEVKAHASPRSAVAKARAPDRGQIVADVVIAGQIEAVDRQRVVQLLGEHHVVAAARPVERDVAAVEHEIGPRRVDVLADAMKIVDRAACSGGRGGCRRSGSGETGTSIDPFGRSIGRREVGTMTISATYSLLCLMQRLKSCLMASAHARPAMTARSRAALIERGQRRRCVCGFRMQTGVGAGWFRRSGRLRIQSGTDSCARRVRIS